MGWLAAQGLFGLLHERLVASHLGNRLPSPLLCGLPVSIDVDHLLVVLADGNEVQSEILRALLPHSRAAMDAVIADVGPLEDMWSTDGLQRSLDVLTEVWGRHYSTLNFASSPAGGRSPSGPTTATHSGAYRAPSCSGAASTGRSRR